MKYNVVQTNVQVPVFRWRFLSPYSGYFKATTLWYQLHFCINYVTENVSGVKRNSKETSEETRKVEKSNQEVENVVCKT
jgi:hypothetical protein